MSCNTKCKYVNSPCNHGTYADMCTTWTPAGSLNPTRWVPFRDLRGVKEGYQDQTCGCNSCSCYQLNPNHHNSKEGYYNTLAGEWRTFTNVTPANYGVQNKFSKFVKEKYGDSTAYLPMDQTWVSQGKYRL